MDKLEAVLCARDMLDDVTPLHGDCGRICGAACCGCDEDGRGGMLLLPGEEALYRSLPAEYSLVPDSSVLPGLYLLICSGICERSMRPYSCRIFPLTPVIGGTEGKYTLTVKADPRSYAVCPLAEQGLRAMDGRFVSRVLESARILCACPEHRAYFRALQQHFERFYTWQNVGGI